MSKTSLLLAVALLCYAIAAGAQTCDDFDSCTANDMCVDGGCAGTPSTSGSCDDGNECTVNDRCTPLGCMGDPATAGTECAGGCGSCQQLAPVPGIPLSCMPKPDIAGRSCDPPGELAGNACMEGACQVFGGIAVTCTASMRQCPDTDGIACTDVCNPATGECVAGVSRCFPGCETCNSETGACEPTNLGTACDDFNPCTTASSCQILLGRGFCLAGTPSATNPTPTAPPATATPTQPVATATQPIATATATAPTSTATSAPSTPTVAAPTATRTSGESTPTPGQPTPTGSAGAATATPTGAIGFVCVGDCNRNFEVRINELILGVNIALGNADLAQCTAFDPNGDTRVAINELIQGTRSALDGCPR